MIEDGALFPAPPAPPSAATLLGGWLADCRVRPPERIIGQVGKTVRGLIGEGIPAEVIAEAMSVWRQRGLHPATLAAVVNEVANRAPARSARQQQTDRLQAGWAAWARNEAQ